MARKSRRTHRSRKGGIFSYIYNPIGQTIKAADNVSKATTNTAKQIVHAGLSGVNRIGSNVTRRADSVVNGLLMRKKRKTQGGRRHRRRTHRHRR